MSIKWEELCGFCPYQSHCENNYGDTCEFTTWLKAKEGLLDMISNLEPEEDVSR